MNWDWEKLKEKQKTNSHKPFFNPKNDQQDKNNANDNNKKDNKDNDEEPFLDFRKLYELSQQKPNYNNHNNNNDDDENPFENFKAPKGLLRNLLFAGVAIWALSGIYIVQPDEAGVVLRFGKYAYTTDAGIHYHLPYPIERVYTPTVTQIRQAEVGFRSNSSSANFQQGRIQNVSDEAAMLTGDENIVNIQFSIQYRIMLDSAFDYLFNVTNPDAVLKNAAEAAMREVIGNNNIDAALTDGKIQIQNDVAELLQNILNKYKVGLEVVSVQMQDVQPPREVSEAFKDVASAREDKIRIINESEAYSNELIPKARGDAAEIINIAEAYKQTRIRNAEGEASRFLAILEEYNKAPNITKERLVYETLENIFNQPGLEKIIVSEGVGNIMPVMPLSPLSSQIPIPQLSTQQNTNSVQPSNSTARTNSNTQSTMRPNPYAQTR